MDVFRRAKAVRLKSHNDKYIVAGRFGEQVKLNRDGAGKTASWIVEPDSSNCWVRLKNCFGAYLTASEEPLFLGWTGKRVTQTLEHSPTFWKPTKVGSKVMLKANGGEYLKGDCGAPPWRNNVTHTDPLVDTNPILWEVEVLELLPVPVPQGSYTSTSSESRFNDIRALAKAYYAYCSNDVKAKVVKLFQSSDSDGNGILSYDEFKSTCVQLDFFADNDSIFQDMDKDNNGQIDFEEAITFFYMYFHRQLSCSGNCQGKLVQSYFSCVSCFEKKKPFYVCVTCYEARAFQHNHNKFLDNSAMLNYIATTSSDEALDLMAILKMLKFGWDVGSTVAPWDVGSIVACSIM